MTTIRRAFVPALLTAATLAALHFTAPTPTAADLPTAPSSTATTYAPAGVPAPVDPFTDDIRAAYADAFTDGCDADMRATFVGQMSTAAVPDDPSADAVTWASSHADPSVSYGWRAQEGGDPIC